MQLVHFFWYFLSKITFKLGSSLVDETIYIKFLLFTDPNHNPFKLTNKTQKQALNYEENLCYCYDCDLEQSTLAIGFQFLENL